MSKTEQIPSPGEYLANLRQLFDYAVDRRCANAADRITVTSNEFIAAYESQDEYHKQRMEQGR